MNSTRRLPAASSALARILVIDDEPAIHRLLRNALGAAGYAVERADSALEGLQLASSLAPDAILLDLNMPDLSGYEVLRRLRGFSSVPVIVLSARTAEADKVAALDGGADDYIVKPFGVAELLARVRVAIRRRRAEEGVAEIIRFPGLEVDITRRQARVDGEAAPLTAKEWALLSLLARNAGRVLTHRQIMNTVWGPAHIQNTQYLRVYIGTLRQKLGDAGALITTDTGIGYRLPACL
jgi:two-component system KDP operon response regulator KdpE